MKRILLLLFILISLSKVKASDTLTVRQIFNFNVGDTFDYAYNFSFSGGFNSRTYSRFVITSKTTSIGNDTITYTRKQLYPAIANDVLVYTNLDSSVFQIFDTTSRSQYLSFDTAYLVDGRLTDSLTEDVPLSYGSHTAKYGEGLGLMYSGVPGTDGSSYWTLTDTILIYYSKGTDTYGAPYYESLGPNYAHYTPIPEDCAFWNYCGYAGAYSDIYQVRTGNKVFYNTHTYVELILRSFVNNTLSADSTVGFFRNDTLGQKVYFTLQPGGIETVLYDFTFTNTKAMSYDPSIPGMADTVVSSGYIGGIQRAIWNFNAMVYSFPDPGVNSSQTVEGIGAFIGFFHSSGLCSTVTGITPVPTCSPELQFFCLCGQNIYQSNNPYYHPDILQGQCAVLTGTSNINSINSKYLYPNPTSDQLHLSISDFNGSNYQLILIDILGQEVYYSPVKESETTHDISRLASGIYTWRLITDNTIISTGKLIKE